MLNKQRDAVQQTRWYRTNSDKDYYSSYVIQPRPTDPNPRDF